MLVGLSGLLYSKGMRESVEEYIKSCLVCQKTKYSTQSSGGYLQPLPTPTAVWEDGFWTSQLGCHYEKGSREAQVFVEAVVKHHGIPKTIVSDRDPIFVSKFWTQLFKLSGTQLNHSTTYHPQTEVVNRGLEQGAMVPLSIIPYPPGSSKVAAVEDVLVVRDELLRRLKDNLLAGKNRIEENANLKRCKWSL
nr:hypothetical protein [Tanacetum cinerariifolium]